jgi:hypothetical protein
MRVGYFRCKRNRVSHIARAYSDLMGGAPERNVEVDVVVATGGRGHRKREDVAASRYDSDRILAPACESEC